MAMGLYFEWPVLLALFIPSMIGLIGNALAYGNTSTLGLQATHDKAHGSAVLNFLNIGLGALAVFSLGLHTVSPLLILPVMSGICILIILVSFFKLK